jgi:hypothetical protein
MTTKTFAFNITFTRPDENDAITYVVGHNVTADTREEADIKVRVANDHLTVSKVELFAVMDEDGNVLETIPTHAAVIAKAVADMEAWRHINITAIDATGTYRATQLWTNADNQDEALAKLEEWRTRTDAAGRLEMALIADRTTVRRFVATPDGTLTEVGR